MIIDPALLLIFPPPREWDGIRAARASKTGPGYKKLLPKYSPDARNVPDPLSGFDLIRFTRPSPLILRSMLKQLVDSFGAPVTRELLGLSGRRSGERVPIGRDAWVDTAVSAGYAKAVWYAWSLSFCPSSLRDMFHVRTWGVFNQDYEGPVADAHREFMHTQIAKLRGPARGLSEKRRRAVEKRRRIAKKRRLKLPKGYRFPRRGDPEHTKIRKELLARILEEEAEEKKRLRERVPRSSRKWLKTIKLTRDLLQSRFVLSARERRALAEEEQKSSDLPGSEE